MTIITRISPSPTGSMHLGTARTALYNWLYARAHGGEFHIRIEDTDQSRNQVEAIQPIIDGLDWLGLDHDGPIVFQSANVERHREVALQLLASGQAYRCYLTADELKAQREAAAKSKMTFLLRSPWRDQVNDTDQPYSVRIKMPQTGETTINDLIQGPVTVQNKTLDDFIILRADGTPTYMLAVVVDDHDTGVTTILRGDDHLNNAFRQLPIYRAMGWPEPVYGHMPLIYDEAGKKLSKRHGAAGLETYHTGGYLPEAMFNYLLRMGWGSGDHEIISKKQALALFTIDGVGKAPARIDQKRLEHLNATYIRETGLTEFFFDILSFMDEHCDGARVMNLALMQGLVPLVKERSKTLVEACQYIDMVLKRPETKVDDPNEILLDFNADLVLTDFTADEIKAVASKMADARGMKLKHVVEPLRLAMMGSKISPPLFDVMALLGATECQTRLHYAITGMEDMRVYND